MVTNCVYYTKNILKNLESTGFMLTYVVSVIRNLYFTRHVFVPESAIN